MFNLRILGIILIPFLFGFSENVRRGYLTCNGCHLSPSGGGALTQYGRWAGNGMMVAYQDEGWEGPTWGTTPIPKWMIVGGDLRYLILKENHFPMQLDLEVGGISETDWGFLGGSIVGGLYPNGDKATFQNRRGYGLIHWHGHSLRYGRFFPNFGINLADHSRPIRSQAGFFQGGETTNIEFHYTADFGELTLTRKIGAPAYQYPGYYEKGEVNEAIIAKAVGFLGDYTRLGASYLRTSNDLPIYAAHVVSGYYFGYLKAQINLHPDKSIGYLESGVIPISGLHLLYYGDWIGEEFEGSIGAKIYPIPHLEFTARGNSESLISTIHYYW